MPNEATVPLLKGLRTEGGTFYTFSSAMNDAILLFSNNNIQMNFSKFACLKLPEWSNVTTQRLYRNPVDIASTNDTPGTTNANTFFPKAYFQNYMENFLSYVDAERSDNDFSNFVEAAFWKSLQSVSDADNNLATTADHTIQLVQDSTYIDPASTTRSKFKEIPGTSSYDQVIQFVGDVNMHNHKKHQGKEYLEVFAHIANSQGRINEVLLKPNDHLTGQVSVAQVPTTAGPDYVVGQETAYTTADAASATYAKAIYDTPGRQYNVTGDRDFLQIDWDDLALPASDSKKQQGNFEFNAILLYYDVQDVNDATTKRRNLYGILVLDKMTEVSPVIERINSLKKFQPNANQAGNALGFLFNLMFSNNTNQITSTVSINDTSLVAMQLYSRALERLQEVVTTYEQLENIILKQQTRLSSLEAKMLGLQNRIINDTVFNQLKQDVETLKNQP